jgi:hypothetical protein
MWHYANPQAAELDLALVFSDERSIRSALRRLMPRLRPGISVRLRISAGEASGKHSA